MTATHRITMTAQAVKKVLKRHEFKLEMLQRDKWIPIVQQEVVGCAAWPLTDDVTQLCSFCVLVAIAETKTTLEAAMVSKTC